MSKHSDVKEDKQIVASLRIKLNYSKHNNTIKLNYITKQHNQTKLNKTAE